jgi:hypothetical protein
VPSHKRPAGGSGPGTTDHAVLTHLDKASSGHTGFSADPHTHLGGDVTSAVANATNAANVDWSGVANKPSTYPATAHTHVGGDVTTAVANATTAANVDWTGIQNKPATYPPSTHSHAESDVTGLVTDLGNKEATANKGAVSGYCGLDASQKVPIGNIPTGTTSSTVCIGNDSRLSTPRAVTFVVGDGLNTVVTGAQGVFPQIPFPETSLAGRSSRTQPGLW